MTSRDHRRCLVPLAAVLTFLVAPGCGDTPTEPSSEVDCTRYPDQATSPYVLPYAVGAAFEVVQTLGHRRFGTRTEWAIDFAMPEGTPLHAPAAGTVVHVIDHFVDGDLTPGHENFVVVESPDGSAWDFGHLQHRSVLKEVGDEVEQGELVARSGLTGNTASPHLHLEIRRCWGGAPYDACSTTKPATFRNTTPHPCGLQVGVTYRARPF